MPQYRVYYAIEQFGLCTDGTTPTDAALITVHGLQSVGITTTFNLEQVFELGQLAIYENVEGIPDVEVTTEKVLDGYPPVYLLATRPAVGAPALVGTGIANRQNEKATGALHIWSDTLEFADHNTPPLTQCIMSGLFVSSLTYTFPVDGSSTESCTLVGNNKSWLLAAPKGLGMINAAGDFDIDDDDISDDVPVAAVGVARREDVNFTDAAFVAAGLTVGGEQNDIAAGHTACVLPPEVDGISSSGTNDVETDGKSYKSHLQSLSVSTDLGRENLFELGRKGAYFRYVSFPVEVTTEITALATSGDMITALEDETNLAHRRIRIASNEGLRLDCGDKNKLASVSMTGGDAGGDNMEISYSYTNFNDLKVNHSHTTVKLTGHQGY